MCASWRCRVDSALIFEYLEYRLLRGAGGQESLKELKSLVAAAVVVGIVLDPTEKSFGDVSWWWTEVLRRWLAQRETDGEEGFSRRGQEVLRIEGFADAVFGFALTLLVVSLEVPNNFDELLSTVQGFFAFAISGLLLYSVWFDHYRFFRRYGLKDNLTIHLSAVLLFVVLFYVYPLKFLFTVVTDRILGFSTQVGSSKEMLSR